MIIRQYILDFEKKGFGMFVHFGLYSLSGQGEWTMKLHHIDPLLYQKRMSSFHPDPDWADQMVQTARKAGCQYITLTARHHDGFSLYDTCGLNTYDAPHACGRDLIQEFTEACRKYDITPFFYHTLLDWQEPSYQNDFPAYLQYLRASVRLLCTNYGKIGGIWFDGMWDKPDADWQEDALYHMIRQYQPEAMIINNTGLSKRGELGNIELDSVTFERGKPAEINRPGNAKHIASEMCETLNDHWGYAENDLHYKSTGQLIEELADCRRYRANFLLNTGLMGNGQIRPVDKEIFQLIGKWVSINEEALHQPSPAGIEIPGKRDFLLKYKQYYYLFCFDLPMQADPDVTELSDFTYQDRFELSECIQAVQWLDSLKELSFEQNGSHVCIHTEPFVYGMQYVVRIARITIK